MNQGIYPFSGTPTLGNPQFDIRVKANNDTNTSSAFISNESELKLENLPVGNYSGKYALYFLGLNTTHDAKLTLSSISPSLAKFSTVSVFNGVATGSSPTALTTFGTYLTFGSINGYFGVILDFILQLTAQDSLTLQWAQNTTNASPLTLLKGSRLEIFKA